MNNTPFNNKITRAGLVVYLVYLGVATLSPFQLRSISWYHLPWPIGPIEIKSFDLISNIILFIPFGFLLSFVIPMCSQKQSIQKAVLWGSGVSLLIETAQIAIRGRYPAFNDFFLNAMGSGFGAIVATTMQEKKWDNALLPHGQKIIFGVTLFYVALLFFLPFYLTKPIEDWRHGASVFIGNHAKEEYPWRGQLVAAGVYDQVLSEAEIKQQFQAGPNTLTDARAERPLRIEKNPILSYQFQLPNVQSLQDQSASFPAVDLFWIATEQDRFNDKGFLFTGKQTLMSKDTADKLKDKIAKTNQFAISMWFYPSEQVGQGGRMFSLTKGGYSFFYLQQNPDYFSFVVKGRSLDRGVVRWENTERLSESPHRLIHVVGLYQNSVLQIYANGEKKGETVFRDGLFLLSNKLSLDRIPKIGHILLAILLFWPLGFLLAIVAPNRFLGLKILLTFLLPMGIVFLSVQQTPSYFTKNMGVILIVAAGAGLAMGKRITRGMTL
ncbi:MAG: VanZ family protein [Nitrospirota bacterium]